MEFSDRYRFAYWPNMGVPPVAAGVYAIWNADLLFYCGMSGRQIEQAKSQEKKRYGLFTRLNSHASGKLSSDQFCVYVANRLVIPNLDPNDLVKFGTGNLTLDGLTRKYIHEHLDYQFIIVESSSEAYELETKARRGRLFDQKPLLNPLAD